MSDSDHLANSLDRGPEAQGSRQLSDAAPVTPSEPDQRAEAHDSSLKDALNSPVGSASDVVATTTERRAPTALVALSGPEDGRSALIPGAGGVIGRHTPDLIFEAPRDQWVSRRHARLTYHDGRWWITDLDSANGTSIEGVGDLPPQVEQAIVREHIFRVGHTELMLTTDPQLVAQAGDED